MNHELAPNRSQRPAPTVGQILAQWRSTHPAAGPAKLLPEVRNGIEAVQSDPHRSIDEIDQVLEVDPNHPLGLFLKAVALELAEGRIAYSELTRAIMHDIRVVGWIEEHYASQLATSLATRIARQPARRCRG